MMVKYKVSDLAKDFGLQSKDIVNILVKEIDSAKKTSSTLEEAELDLIFDVLTKQNAVKSFDEYFATGAKAREAAAAERKAEKDRKLAEQMAILEQMKAAAAAAEAAKNPAPVKAEPKAEKKPEPKVEKKPEPKREEPKVEKKPEPKKEAPKA